jgi:hypothetical protein
MKLILHIGMPKTGSTALQHTLAAAAPDLLRHGICYPAGNGLPKDHNKLVCGFTPVERLPRHFRQVYAGDEERKRRDFDTFRSTLFGRIRKSKAHTVVLSAEMLFRNTGPEERAALTKVLKQIAEEITIVAYLRSPAKFYMSQVQQVLKASHRIVAPKPPAYRIPLEAWSTPTEDIRVIPYAREQFHGQDIALDFLHRFFSDLGEVLEPHHMHASNQTLSAEGIDILQKYRLYNHAANDGRHTPDTGELIRLITETETNIGNCTKPVLHARLADYLARASKDLLWLRDRHGIMFDDIEYEAIEEGLAAPSPPREIADICALDPALRDQLAMRVMNRLTVKSTGRRAARKRGMRKRALSTAG